MKCAFVLSLFPSLLHNLCEQSEKLRTFCGMCKHYCRHASAFNHQEKDVWICFLFVIDLQNLGFAKRGSETFASNWSNKFSMHSIPYHSEVPFKSKLLNFVLTNMAYVNVRWALNKRCIFLKWSKQHRSLGRNMSQHTFNYHNP